MVPYCSCCLCLYFGSSIMLVTYFVNFRKLNDRLFGKELFILFAVSAFRKLSIYVFSYFPFGFEGRIWDLTVSVPDHCLSFYSSVLAEPYSLVFISSVRLGHFPTPWKKGNITALHKKEDRSLPSNYRPISLLCQPGKSLERCVHKELHNYINELPFSQALSQEIPQPCSYSILTIRSAKLLTVARNIVSSSVT